MGTYNSDSAIASVNIQPQQKLIANGEIEYPRLNCQVSIYPDAIILSQKDFSYRLSCQPHTIEGIKRLLLKMNGHHHLQELIQHFFPENPEQINTFIQPLVNQGFIEDAKNTSLDLKQKSILKWEQLFAKQLSEELQQQSLQLFAASPSVSINQGFIIEYYHLLSHTSDFYTPLLSFQHSTKIRHYLNQFYGKIYRQNELLFQGCQQLGISPVDLEAALPLPETVALSNALTFWSYSDPLFCISLLAIWEVQLLQTWTIYLNQFYLDSVNALFLETIQQFIQLKIKSKPEELGYLIVSDISPFEDSILARFKRQMHLFIELNHNFNNAIANYYSSTSCLIRNFSNIEFRGKNNVDSN
ncbi:MAG: hypothetical protein WBA13_20660 [Microcoleaceae cyanobacterium]